MPARRTALVAALVALALAAAVALPGPGFQDERNARPVSPDGIYSATDLDGNLQKALDASLAKAMEALSNPGGQTISDYRFDWQLLSVSGTRGGITGKRDVTVRIQVVR